jgi:nicotinamidase-related amidase
MPEQNPDLHGNVPDTSDVAVLLIDWINHLEFPGADRLLPHALAAADATAGLKRRARAAGVPVVYVNDNFGRWRSDFTAVVDHCLHDGVRGRPLAERLRPGEEDYFVLKPKHSGFYSTALDLLLKHLEAHTLVLAGLTGDNCVLFTAADAYLRDYKLFVPSDCVASIDPDDNRQALAHMRRVLKAETGPSTDLDLAALRRPRLGGPGGPGARGGVSPGPSRSGTRGS